MELTLDPPPAILLRSCIIAGTGQSILPASLQVFTLLPYHTNVAKRLVKRSKLYLLDTGLCAYLAE